MYCVAADTDVVVAVVTAVVVVGTGVAGCGGGQTNRGVAEDIDGGVVVAAAAVSVFVGKVVVVVVRGSSLYSYGAGQEQGYGWWCRRKRHLHRHYLAPLVPPQTPVHQFPWPLHPPCEPLASHARRTDSREYRNQ